MKSQIIRKTKSSLNRISNVKTSGVCLNRRAEAREMGIPRLKINFLSRSVGPPILLKYSNVVGML